MFDRVVTILSENPELATLGAPQLDSAIDETQERLGVQFPESYREFLRRWGWMWFGPNAYFGLGTTVENVVIETERARLRLGLPAKYVVVADHDGDELVCLDTGALRPDAECPVSIWNCIHGGLSRTCANSFEAFLQRDLEDFAT